MLMKFPAKISKNELSNSQSILDYGQKLIRHFDEELAEYRAGLDILAKTRSPLLLHHIFEDGLIYAKGDTGNIDDRLKNAKEDAKQKFNRFYWESLQSDLVERIYGGSTLKDLSHFFKNQFVGHTKERYIDFNEQNLNTYIHQRLFNPLDSNKALSVIEEFIEIIKTNTSYFILKDNRLDIQNIAFHSKNLNRFVTQEDFMFALIVYVHKDQSTDTMLGAMLLSVDAIQYTNKERWGSEIGRNYDGDRFYIKGLYLEQIQNIGQTLSFSTQ